MLHLRCGDDIIPMLRDAGLPGDVAKWGDPLCEGPLRMWPDDASRREERAAWLSARYGDAPAQTLHELEVADAALARTKQEDEVVLWFEHDLFDQAILIFLLDRLADLAPGRTSLICVGSYPGVPEFIGLGQLSADQLATLFPGRIAVTPEQFATAQEAWVAMRGGDPERIWTLAATGTPALPFLSDALRRWLAELPSTRNGLSLTESFGLQAVAAGADMPRHAFPVVQRFESRPWLGDAMFYATLRLLAGGPHPLLVSQNGRLPGAHEPGFALTKLEVTEEGRGVLAGRADWFRLSQPSRWHGSILLEGPEPAWRWDERGEKPVKC